MCMNRAGDRTWPRRPFHKWLVPELEHPQVPCGGRETRDGSAMIGGVVDGPRFLTLTDVAEVLNISASQTYALVRSGDLAAIKVGGRGQWRVERSQLEDYIARMYAETAQFVAEHPLGARATDQRATRSVASAVNGTSRRLPRTPRLSGRMVGELEMIGPDPLDGPDEDGPGRRRRAAPPRGRARPRAARGRARAGPRRALAARFGRLGAEAQDRLDRSEHDEHLERRHGRRVPSPARPLRPARVSTAAPRRSTDDGEASGRDRRPPLRATGPRRAAARTLVGSARPPRRRARRGRPPLPGPRGRRTALPSARQPNLGHQHAASHPPHRRVRPRAPVQDAP